MISTASSITRAGFPDWTNAWNSIRDSYRWKSVGAALAAAVVFGVLFYFQNQLISEYNNGRFLNQSVLLFDIAIRLVWVLMAYPIYWLVKRNRIDSASWGRLVLIHAAAAVCFCLIQGQLTFWLLRGVLAVLDQPIDPLLQVKKALLYPHFGKLFSYLILVVLCYAIDFYRRSKELRLKAARLEASLEHAQFEAIRLQMHPQMLFESLDCIATRMGADLESADVHIEALGDYLRLLLESAGWSSIPLVRELADIRAYLSLLEMRLETSLDVDWDIHEDLLDESIPIHILLTLFEQTLETPGFDLNTPLCVFARRNEGFIEIGLSGFSTSLLTDSFPKITSPGVTSIFETESIVLRLEPIQKVEEEVLESFPENAIKAEPHQVLETGVHQGPSPAKSVFTKSEKWWLMNALVWLAIGLLSMDRVGWFIRTPHSAGLLDALWGSGKWMIWALLTPAIVWLTQRYPLVKTQFVSHLMVLMVGCCLSLLVFLGLDFLLLLPAWGTTSEAFADALGNFQFVFLFIGYCGVVIYGHADTWANQYSGRKLQNARLSQQLAHARLTALKMQLHPHFLFNTLNSISELMHQNIEASRQMIRQLQQFLSLTLRKAESPEITLGEELEFLQSYLAIQQVRFVDRLRVELNVPDEIRGRKVPTLILQPIVENAIRYGISEETKRGVIRILAEQNNGNLHLEVWDNGPGFSGSFRQGFGLSNTRARLKQSYGNACRFELGNAPEGGTLVVLEIPTA